MHLISWGMDMVSIIWRRRELQSRELLLCMEFLANCVPQDLHQMFSLKSVIVRGCLLRLRSGLRALRGIIYDRTGRASQANC